MRTYGDTRGFRFERYSDEELLVCGEAFRADLMSSVYGEGHLVRPDGTDLPTFAWTTHVLSWFADAAGPEVTVHHKSHNAPEFLCDLVHATWPEEPWLQAAAKAFRLRLALESEWGAKRHRRRGTKEILRDATKLATVRAETKVMIFGSCSTNHRCEILSLLGELRTYADDGTPWLWVDAPWGNGPDGIWAPDFGILNG